MVIRRGTRANSRHARNYIGQQADARLQEVVQPMRQQQWNALTPDSLAIEYYQNVPSTLVCTCRQVDIEQSTGAQELGPTLTSATGDVEVKVDWKAPLFGQRGDSFENSVAVDDGEDDFDSFEDNTGQHSGHLFGQAVDCGICYRTGFVPGLLRYGADRQLLTTHNIVELSGYTMLQDKAPTVFQKLDRRGFVMFEVDVPQYFTTVHVSVRNNREVLDDYLYTIGQDRLSLSAVGMSRGKKLVVKVMAQEFTHAVIDFDLGAEPLRANFAQMNRTLDWTMLDTLGNITVILPNTLPNTNNGDVIYVPSRNQTFKVTDVTHLQTARDFKLDWSVTTRIIQPQEALKQLHNRLAIL